MNPLLDRFTRIEAELPEDPFLEATVTENRIVFHLPEAYRQQERKVQIIATTIGCLVLAFIVYWGHMPPFTVAWMSLWLAANWLQNLYIERRYLRQDGVRYFEIDTRDNRIIIPRPQPYHPRKHQAIDLHQVESLYLDRPSFIASNKGTIHLVLAGKNVKLLSDTRFRRTRLMEITRALASLLDKPCKIEQVG